MALRVISDATANDDDLPWINEFIEQGNQVGTASFVRHVKKTPKGYLILAEEFKGFLFSKSTIAGFITEALEAWVDNSAISYPLYAIADKGGKLSLAVDDTEGLTLWIEDGKGKSWEQKRKKGRGDGIATNPSNPFLPTPPPTQRTKSKGSTEPHPDANAMPS